MAGMSAIVRQSLGRGDPEHAQVAVLALRNDLRAAEDHVDGAGDGVLDGARIAVVGHVDHLDVCRFQKILAGQMRNAARRGGGERKLAGLPAGERDQLRDALDRQLRRGRQHQRPIGREDDRLEVALDVIGHRLERVRRQRQRCALRIQQRIAVGRRLRDVHGAGDAAGAGPVLDDDLLSPSFGQRLGDDARRNVGRGARAARNHQPDEAAWASFGFAPAPAAPPAARPSPSRKHQRADHAVTLAKRGNSRSAVPLSIASRSAAPRPWLRSGSSV